MAPMLHAEGDPVDHLPIEEYNNSILSMLPRRGSTRPSNNSYDEEDDESSNGSGKELNNEVSVSEYEDCPEKEVETRIILENYHNFIDAAANGDIVALKTGLELGMEIDRVTAKGHTVLVIAITEMQVDAVKFLLDNGAYVNHRVNNLPPLAHAVSRPERGPELVQLLIDHGAIVTTVSRPDCRTILHCAAAVGTTETLEFLVQKGVVDLEGKCKRGCTPLLVAAKAGNIKNAEVLLHLGAKLDVVSDNGGTPLIWSISSGNVDAVKFWLQRPNIEINAQDCYGRTALFLACQFGTLEVVNMLLSNGANPNILCTTRNKVSPLQVAILKNNVEIIKALANHGANLDQRNSFGENTLDVALTKRRSKAIQALLKYQGGDDYPTESVALEIAMAEEHDTVRAIMSTAQIIYPHIAKHNRNMTLSDFEWIEWVLKEGGILIRPRAICKMMHVALEEQNVAKVHAIATQGCDINARLESGHTPLSFAVGHRNLELIKTLLAFGADPTRSCAGRDHCTPLDNAILHMKHGGDTAVVNILLATGRCLINNGKDSLDTAFSYVLMKAAERSQEPWSALAMRMVESVKDINKDKCASGNSLLHVATVRESLEFIELLLSKGANIEATNELGVTPLIMACQRSPNIIPILIERGADIDALYKAKSGVLAGAASYGNVESLKVLLEIHGRDIEVKTEHGHTPLACALTWGEEEAALYLIYKGANVHWRTQEKKQTALQFAARERLVKVVEELLKRGVDVNAKDTEGWTPLHEACALGNAKVIRMLLDAGANFEAALPNGDRPLHTALLNKQQSSAVSLINHGADITARASKNRTPLHICSEYELPFAARVLLNYGASTEEIDDETWTPLCNCAGANFADFLIANGANVNYRDKDDWSPLHQAINAWDYELAEVLLMNGAEIEVRTTDDGLSVMERALDIPDQEDARRFVRLLMRTIRLRKIEEENKGKNLIKIVEDEGEEKESDSEGSDVGGRFVVV